MRHKAIALLDGTLFFQQSMNIVLPPCRYRGQHFAGFPNAGTRLTSLMQKKASNPLKIDVVVHGRFHAFHLARALNSRGHDVRLLTNYPRNVVAKFGFPSSQTATCLAHGIVTRIYHRLPVALHQIKLEAALHRWFGRWACSKVRKNIHLIYIFSGISEETLKAIRHIDGPQVWVVRGSSHIRTQYELLQQEESRSRSPIEKPSPWMIAREEREYRMAARIITLSSFARQSFISQSVPQDKVTLLLSAVDVSRFRPSQETIQNRCYRIKAGHPLRVLMVGAFSLRKGAVDLVKIAECLSKRMNFRVVGDVLNDAVALKEQARSLIEFAPRVPEFELQKHYSWGDLFIFPTIEDGYPAVLAQALTAGLPVLATSNSSAPDIVKHGETGWILPIRSSSKFVDQLNWCDSHRDALADMVERLQSGFPQRDWQEMAADLEQVYANVGRAG